MLVDAETVIDRRRLKRGLTLWRFVAVVLGLGLLLALILSGQQLSGPGGILPHVARITISGVITDDRNMYDLLDKVGKSDQVKAVILDINSPGGTTTGGEGMYDAIQRLAQKKPVVAVCGTLATSAAYIVALATDRIFVYGNTITGSVGAIFQWVQVNDLLDKLGVKVEEARSGPLKAIPDPFQPTDEKGRALSQEMVDDAKTWFVGLVAKRRNLDPQSIPGLTDGRIYSGRQAVDLKLVDQLGDEHEALAWLEKERHIPSGLKIVDWKPDTDTGGPLSWLFGSMARSFGASAGKISALLTQTSQSLELDGLLSLWHPASS